MSEKGNENFLEILQGEKLSSVTFVMDYLQLDFDGYRLTLNDWPIVIIDNIMYRYGEQPYRDKLCSLITKIVSEVVLVIDDILILKFSTYGSITLSLDPNYLRITSPEIVTFCDTKGHFYVLHNKED
jgi:hypothetical protein